MKILKKILVIVIFVVFVFVILNILPKNKFQGDNHWLKENNDNRPLIISHGGGLGVNPGNTMRAFQYSYDNDVDVIELDVHLTSEQILVTRHGENQTGNIRQMSNCDTVIWENTYQWLYDNCNFGYNYQDDDDNYPFRDMTHSEWVEAGVYMTQLEELFLTFGNNILYIIEIKADADAPRTESADALYELIELYDLFDNILVATSYEDISNYITLTYPKITQSTSHDDAEDMIIKTYTFTNFFFDPVNNAALQLPTTFNVPVINELNLATRYLINNAHKHNMAVHFWTINDPDEMRRLIDLGADGIITDYPEILRDVINEE